MRSTIAPLLGLPEVEEASLRRWLNPVSVSFPAGGILLREEGAVDDAVYLIASGQATLERQGAPTPRILAVLGPGDLIGEGELLLGDAHTDVVRAQTSLTAWLLSYRRLEELQVHPASAPLVRQFDRLLLATRLRSTSPFSGLPSHWLLELSDALQVLRVGAGTVLARPGEVADRLWIVRRGWLAVSPPGSPAPALALGPGEWLGASGLVTGGTYQATLWARTDLQVYVLPRAAVDQVLARQPHLWVSLEPEVASVPVTAILARVPAWGGESPHQLRHLARQGRLQQGRAGEPVATGPLPSGTLGLLRRGQLCRRKTGAQTVPGGGEVEHVGLGAVLTGPALGEARYEADSELWLLPAPETEWRRTGRERPLEVRPQRNLHSSLRAESGAGGESLYVLTDLERGTAVKLSSHGAFLWELLDGQHTLRDLAVAYTRRFGLEARASALEVVAALGETGFLQAKEQPRARRWPCRPARYESALAPRDRWGRLLESLYRRGGWLLFTLPGQAALWLVALAGGMAAVWLAWQAGNWGPAPASWHPAGHYLFLTVNQAAHELAHALTALAHGGRVPHAHVSWTWGLPRWRVDTSGLWTGSPRTRLLVTWAGPFWHLAAGGALALAVVASPAGPWAPHLRTALSWEYLLWAVSLCPLLDQDGYHLLMDLCQIPRLRARAAALLRSRGGGGGDSERGIGRSLKLFAAGSALCLAGAAWWLLRHGQPALAALQFPWLGEVGGQSVAWLTTLVAWVTLGMPSWREWRRASRPVHGAHPVKR